MCVPGQLLSLSKLVPAEGDSICLRWIWDWTNCLFMSLPLPLCLQAFVGRLLSFHKPLTLELPSSYNILTYFECASIGWLSISVGCWFESVHSMRAHRVSRCVSDFVRSPSFCCTLPPLPPTVSPTLSRTLLPICLPACGHLVSQLVSQHFSPWIWNPHCCWVAKLVAKEFGAKKCIFDSMFGSFLESYVRRNRK